MPRRHPAWWCLKSSFLFQDHFKSAFFYFEGVFYNDMRFPECVDISRSVLLRLSLNIAVNQKVFCCHGSSDTLPRMLAREVIKAEIWSLILRFTNPTDATIIELNLLLTTLKLSKQDFWVGWWFFYTKSTSFSSNHLFYECINSVPISIPIKKIMW